MKFELRQQTQYKFFNKLILQQTQNVDFNIQIEYSTSIYAKFHNNKDIVKFLKQNKFYLILKSTSESTTNLQRLCYHAQSLCNDVIGYGVDQLHFSENDIVGQIETSTNKFYFIEIQ